MNIQLDPKDKKRIEKLARESGMDPDEFVGKLLHEALDDRVREDNSSPNNPDAAWQQFLQAGSEWAKKRPATHTVDDSRQAIYNDRGE
jgi:hypothetical protein